MQSRLKCTTCGKDMEPPDLDVNDEGLEGYLARNMPQPDQAFCSPQCYEQRYKLH